MPCAVRVVVTGQQVSASVLLIDLDPHPLLEPPSLGYIYHAYSRVLRISFLLFLTSNCFCLIPTTKTDNEITGTPAGLRPRVLGAPADSLLILA